MDLPPPRRRGSEVPDVRRRFACDHRTAVGFFRLALRAERATESDTSGPRLLLAQPPPATSFTYPADHFGGDQAGSAHTVKMPAPIPQVRGRFASSSLRLSAQRPGRQEPRTAHWRESPGPRRGTGVGSCPRAHSELGIHVRRPSSVRPAAGHAPPPSRPCSMPTAPRTRHSTSSPAPRRPRQDTEGDACARPVVARAVSQSQSRRASRCGVRQRPEHRDWSSTAEGGATALLFASAPPQTRKDSEPWFPILLPATRSRDGPARHGASSFPVRPSESARRRSLDPSHGVLIE